MSSLTAVVAGTHALRTVPGEMSHLVAGIAGRREAPRVVPLLGAIASNVPSLGAVVTGGFFGGLLALFGDMPDPVAPITSVLVFLTLAGEVPETVAFVALVASSAESAASSAAAASAPVSYVRAFPRKVPLPVASITHTGAHSANAPAFFYLQTVISSVQPTTPRALYAL